MKKPPKGSRESLSSKKLYDVLKTRDVWSNSEIMDLLADKYTAYDREGLGHRIRQILSDYTKRGILERIEKGTYRVKI